MATPAPPRQRVHSWGRLSDDLHTVTALRDRQHPGLAAAPDAEPVALYGNGRSYGDVCLNDGGRLLSTRELDRFIAFDAASGVLECEAGVLLSEIIDIALPRGWFLPVSPGTRYATLGGAIANDVHGKNHHVAGTLGEHVLSLVLARSDGSQITCGPKASAPWFEATVGGLGLTGAIISGRLQLKRVPGEWMDCETLPFHGLGEFFELSRASEAAFEYTVAWIDCVHGQDTRGIFFRANHADSRRPAPRQKARGLAIMPPFSLINQKSLRAFNAVYFQLGRWRQGRALQHLIPFFYPLDGVRHWNRVYGPRGFYQYQCVLPRAVEAEATAELMAAIRRSGRGSFLAVLKTFGDRAPVGILSFPMAGTTLALDFPNEGAPTLALFDTLDAIVDAAGGRLYAAKDARMSGPMFKRGYPRWAELQAFRDPAISSAMSRRLLGS